MRGEKSGESERRERIERSVKIGGGGKREGKGGKADGEKRED